MFRVNAVRFEPEEFDEDFFPDNLLHEILAMDIEEEGFNRDRRIIDENVDEYLRVHRELYVDDRGSDVISISSGSTESIVSISSETSQSIITISDESSDDVIDLTADDRASNPVVNGKLV